MLNSFSNAEVREKIVQNLKDTKNLDFNFEQNINGKIENNIINKILNIKEHLFYQHDLLYSLFHQLPSCQ